MPALTLKTKRAPKKAPKKTEAVKTVSPLTEAREAVGLYESERGLLDDMKENWSDTYPEAATELDAIANQEDAVMKYINMAKPLVAKAGETVGPFKCILRNSSPGYDPKEILNLLIESGDRELIFDLIVSGVIEKINLGKDSAKVYFDRHDEASKIVAKAWRKSEPLTPSVSVPKL